MMTTTSADKSRLSIAKEWLAMFQADYPDEPGATPRTEQDLQTVKLLIRFTQFYIRFLSPEDRANEFDNPLDEFVELKGAAADANAALDHLPELQEARGRESSFQSLFLRWIFGAVLHLVIRMKELEEQYPGLPAMRAEYEQFCETYLS
jgi:hypothetical protein